MKIVLSLFLLFPIKSFAEFQIPPLESPVVDAAGMLSSSERQTLNNEIRDYRGRGGPQIGVLIVNSLGGLTIEEAAIKAADKWKLGGAKGDDGLLVLLSKEEHGVRLEVGQGLEGVLPDAYAKRIIEDTMIPYFKDGRFGQGIEEGLSRAASYINKDIPFASGYREYRERPTRPHLPPFFKFLFFIFMMIMFIRFPWLFLAFGGRGGGSSSWGGGSSGGWSGGGGGFSGGGASGRW